MASVKRISKELAECSDPSALQGITVTPLDADVSIWHVTLTGPAASPYEGGTFGVRVELGKSYPFKAPLVRFVTRIYHPNVTNDSDGSICIAALKPEQWKPATRISSVLQALRQLLVEPNPDDPLEGAIADEFRHNRDSFDRNARDYVKRYASKPDPFA
ncbi:hypothetical protein M406DRAFT_39675 [Cryphonectria parasitica EP155]|uniref:E2 ubiquitin-conjugating enzyme n=1 Tax=Cryphonectria parasitica (strain ATCC 38755 / EP155) TaxID=660469 RepID=A0A9P4Y5L5_CRYP1|nr:uncharacterized protein M406DRAFT_39675 [Cryphonectria parasitica EP155]KAF3766930.1 hypothetical protein M406DRAFT_39675 [Cryphonectria parasitica EP155]